MPVLREVVTRFKFEQDKKGVNKFNRTMRGMKNNVRGLAKLFGISLGLVAAKSLFNMGIAAEKARFDVKRLGGVSMKKLIGQFNAIKNSSKALSGLREQDFFKSGAAFFKVFGGGEKQAKQFVRLFELAAKLSRLTNQNVTDVFKQLGQGIETGDFSFLNEIKGFDKTRIQNIKDELNIIAPQGEFLSGTRRAQKLNKLLNLTAGATRQIDNSLKNVPPAMIKSQKAAEKFKDTMDKLAVILTSEMVPALRELNKTLSQISKVVDFLSKSGVLKFLNKAEKFTNPLKFPFTINEEIGGRVRKIKESFKNGSPFRETARGAGRPTTVTIHNKFDIKGTDPAAISMEVRDIVEDVFRKASDSILPTEER